MMRMMMEQPEHRRAFAFETLTIYVRMNIFGNKNSIWGFVGSSASTIFGSTWQLGFSAAHCGPITCVWRTLLALVTYIYGGTYSLVGDVVVRIVFKLVKSSFNNNNKKNS